jgi:hypothetical protein
MLFYGVSGPRDTDGKRLTLALDNRPARSRVDLLEKVAKLRSVAR